MILIRVVKFNLCPDKPPQNIMNIIMSNNHPESSPHANPDYDNSCHTPTYSASTKIQDHEHDSQRCKQRTKSNSDHQIPLIDKLQTMNPSNPQIVTPTISKTLFEVKRPKIMEWLQVYSQKFHLSRNATALAQLYTDLYFSIEEYHSKGAIQILAAILLIASKYSETHVIDANILACILNIEIKDLTILQLEICWKLDFDLSWTTYNMTVDQGIQQLLQQTAINFYQADDQKSYISLRTLHSVFQSLYVTEGHQPTLDQVKFCIEKILMENKHKKQSQSLISNSVDVNLQQEKEKQEKLLTYFSLNSPNQISITKNIEEKLCKKIKDISQQKKEDFIMKFRERKNVKNYSFEDFCTRYFL